jgi:putative membrane protein
MAFKSHRRAAASHYDLLPLRMRHRVHLLAILFIVLWIVAAIAPVDRVEWWEANIPIAGVLVIVAASYRWWPLSDLSYALIAIFEILAVLGAHYTYERMPVGQWLQQLFGATRNPYDRAVHFGVGLLLAYPVRENLVRVARTRPPWTYLLPVTIIMAASSLWEIFEVFYGIGMHANGDYVGTGGDPFDSQHDMACALAGASVAMSVTIVCEYRAGLRNRRETKMSAGRGPGR